VTWPTASSPPAWAFSTRSGASANGTDMTSRYPDAPQGNQVAFLQSKGTIG
jgi:hypothetical protein